MPKVLVTGGAGFIGYHLARRLAAADCEVDILDNEHRGVRDRALQGLLAKPGLRLIRADLCDPAVARDLDTDYDLIFHFAAIIGVQHVRSRPYEVLTKNSAMLMTAIEVARHQHSLQRLVFASTSEIYAGTLQHFSLSIPTPEDTALTISDLSNPRTSYMLSKLYGEAMCKYAGVPSTVVRFHNIYGPRMGRSHVIPQLLQKAHGLTPGQALQVASVAHRRSFCFVEDAVEYLMRMADSPACADKTFNVGTEAPEVRIDELARVILSVVGRDAPIDALPAEPGSPDRRAPDMSNAIKATGYRSRVGLATGVSLTYEWYLEHVFTRAELCAV